MRRFNLLVIEIAMFLLLLIGLFSSVCSNGVENQKKDLSNNLITRIIPLTYTSLEEREEHIFLGQNESVTFSAPLQSGGFQFKRTHVIIGAANPLFLREMNMDLYVETYNYWGENVGAWTNNNSFTLTNPGEENQELFLKISNRYGRRRYVMDNVDGTQHSITFTTDTTADRISVFWGFAAALKYLEVNETRIDVGDMLSSSQPQIMLEYLFLGASFRLPSPMKIHNTSFSIIAEEIGLPQRPATPRINAWIYPETVVTLNAHQEILYEIPEINGWTYSNAGFASNVTPSLYPTPYPFELINLAVWNPEENPVSTTPIDVTFGIKNLSNDIYHLSFYPTLYYWQNQTGIAYTYQNNITETSIFHIIHVNISDASVGADLGLKGHYLSFGATGKTVKFDAPEPVGKFSNSYIPLKEGSYTLITMEPRITSNFSISVNDLSLSATLNFSVMYDGDPYANAEISVLQKGMFTNKTYETSTDENGRASIIVHAGGPEVEEFEINVTKDAHNYVKQVITVTIGTLWITLIVLLLFVTVTLLLLYLRMHKKRKNKYKKQKNT